MSIYVFNYAFFFLNVCCSWSLLMCRNHLSQTRSALFCVVMQRVVVISYDVSGQPIDPIFTGQESNQTSVRNYHYSLHNSPEEPICFAADA